jgi:hypothetical protein
VILDLASSTLSVASGNCITWSGGKSPVLVIQNLTLTAPAGNCLSALYGAHISIGANVVFGVAQYGHIGAQFMARVTCWNNYSITGGALSHIWLDAMGFFLAFFSVATLTGTPAFGQAFITCQAASQIHYGSSSYSGPAIGKRYIISGLAGVINNEGGQVETFFPGNAAGTISDEGYFDLVVRRRRLTADETFYVRTDGSDSNNGSANTAGGAFLTIQKAINHVSGNLDLNGYNVTIQVNTGTYTGNIVVAGPWAGAGTVTLSGDTTTPSNVLLSTVGAAITVGSSKVSGARLSLKGFKITTSSNGDAISLLETAFVTIDGNMEYGAVGTGRHLHAIHNSSIIVNANYTISGGAGAHMFAAQNSRINNESHTITLTGSPVFSEAFAKVTRLGAIICGGNTFSGAAGATSPRYSILTMSLIDTAGGGASYLPGTSAGSGGSSTFDGTGFYN